MSTHQRLKRTMRSPVRQAVAARKHRNRTVTTGYLIIDELGPKPTGQPITEVRARVKRIEKIASLTPRTGLDRVFRGDQRSG